MKQLISILIPAFNSGKWIRDCVESALAQTWPWKEIIIVDDGSQDATLEIARSYCSPSVQVETQNNRGASAARNRALSLAQGDYIQWLDADDLLAPDKIAKQLEGAEPGHSSRVLLSGAWGQFYHCPERSRFIPTSLWEDLQPAEWLFRKVDQNLWMAIESWLVSRGLTEMAGPWNETLYRDNDGEYFCRVLSCSRRTRFIPEARCFCRMGTFSSISHGLSLTDRKLNSESISILSYIQRLRTMEDSPRTRAACLKLLQRWAIYFYPERPDLLGQLEYMATDLGGRLGPPTMRAKYRWLQKTLGWRIAKKAQHALPVLRSLLEKYCERFLRLRSTGFRRGRGRYFTILTDEPCERDAK
jgi:glycosyltransferase involved in cell wall biosynthesis